MTLRARLLADALCNFTPDLVGGKCQACRKALKEDESVYWFAGSGGAGMYVGDCCAKKFLK